MMKPSITINMNGVPTGREPSAGKSKEQCKPRSENLAGHTIDLNPKSGTPASLSSETLVCLNEP